MTEALSSSIMAQLLERKLAISSYVQDLLELGQCNAWQSLLPKTSA